MKLVLSGSHTNKLIDQDRLRRAFRFYCGILFKSVDDSLKLSKCRVDLNITDGLSADYGVDGLCRVVGEPINLKKFSIWIDSTGSEHRCLITLAHETVHFKQLVLKEWIYSPANTWMGREVDKNVNYQDRPWEIEAHKREYELFRRFLDSEMLIPGYDYDLSIPPEMEMLLEKM